MMKTGEGCKVYPFFLQPADQQRDGTDSAGETSCGNNDKDWRGNRWVGTNMGIQKGKAQMRLGFQNVRGLNSIHMSKGFEKFSKWGVDFLGFSDSKTSKEDAIGIKMLQD